uniref:Uncharacterized protein n=1 Tax=Ditylenchus dipsaci TaxID=166011 RepID=A0A915EG19_9BILA
MILIFRETVMLWGLSIQHDAQEPGEPAFQQGTIMNTDQDANDRMCASMIAWPCDSGGGLYNDNGALVGILSSSLSPEGEDESHNLNRVLFVPTTVIRKIL